MSDIRFLPLGGQDERNKNCYVIKIDDDIFIFDCGVKMPVNVKYGISAITPDFNVLKKDANKIKGVFIGYPTHSNYGGIVHLLDKIGYDVPIYCPHIGKIIIETFLEKRYWSHNRKFNLKFNIVEPFSPIILNKTEIVPFSISNSVPGSLGWIIKTQNGCIVFIDDFIISNDRSRIFQSQLNKIDHIVRNNVLALIPGMGIVDRNKGFTSPNYKNIDFYQKVVANAKGRIFVACVDSDVNTIINLANIAKNSGRPFSIYSNTFMNVFSNIVKQKLINIKGLQCLQISDINNSNNAIVIISSNQEQLFKNLLSATNKQNSNIIFNSTDTFVLGTQIVPGYEGLAADLLDQLSKIDLDIAVLPKTVLPMSASAEDQKFLLDKLSPRYVFPIQGLYKSFVKYREASAQTWTKPDQVIFLDNGEEACIENGNLNKKYNNIKLQECSINQAGFDDSSSSIIYEREKLSEAGTIAITIFFNKEKQMFIDKINYQVFGIVSNTYKNNEAISEIINCFKKSLPNCFVPNKKNIIDHKSSKKMMKKMVMKLFEKSFDKRPVVLITIIEC